VADLQSLGLDLSPSEHPLTYPGMVVERSYLLVESWLYDLEPTRAVPLSQWTVKADGGPLSLGDDDDLDTVLLAAGAAPTAQRSPVVAVGSNAAPAQLAYKYRGGDQRSVIPITRALVSNLAVAHSAHISKPGYVPLIPVLAENNQPASLHILWLDVDQVRRMDETEPNYTRILVGPSAATAVLESGVELPSFALYRGRWGALCSEPGAAPLRATSQARVFALLSALDWFLALVPELREGAEQAAGALAHDERRRERVRRELASRVLATRDGLSIDGVATAAHAAESECAIQKSEGGRRGVWSAGPPTPRTGTPPSG